MTKSFTHKKILSAAFIISCFFVWGCHNDYQEVQNMGKKVIPIDEATTVESYLSQDGKVKAKLTSPLMTTRDSDTPQTEFPHTLHVEFYNDSTKWESRLFAKYGLYYRNTRLVFLRDSVIVFNNKGDTLRTEQMWWDQAKEIIYSTVPVHIRKPKGEYIDGTGMTADQNFSKWTITNASGPVNVPDSSLPAN
jgi:LPS export ABC transporter protein LptC